MATKPRIRISDEQHAALKKIKNLRQLTDPNATEASCNIVTLTSEAINMWLLEQPEEV